jgi:hypothetical protein
MSDGARQNPLAALIERAVAASKERAARQAQAGSAVVGTIEPAGGAGPGSGPASLRIGGRAGATRALVSEAIDDADAERVFLTPRVVDARSFAEYSSALKDLIRDASGQGRTLQTASVEVKTLQERVSSSIQELQKKLEISARLVPTIDQRVARAETALDAATKLLAADETAVLGRTRSELERLTRDAVAAAEARLAKAADAASARLEQLVAGAATVLTTKADALAAALDARSQSLAAMHAEALSELQSASERCLNEIASTHRAAAAGLDARAAEVAGESAGALDVIRSTSASERGAVAADLAAARAAFDEARDAAEARIRDVLGMASRDALSQAELASATIRDEATAAAFSISSASAAASEDLAGVALQTRDAMQGAAGECEARVRAADAGAAESMELRAAAGRELNSSLDAASERARKASAEAARWLSEEAVARFQTLISRADALAAPATEDSHGGELVRAVALGEKLKLDGNDALRQLAEIRSQADLARTLLGEDLLAAAEKADAVSARAENAAGRAVDVGMTLDALASRLATLSENAAEQARACDEALASHADRAGAAREELAALEASIAAAALSVQQLIAAGDRAHTEAAGRARSLTAAAVAELDSRAEAVAEAAGLRAMELEALVDRSGEALATLDEGIRKAESLAASFDSKASDVSERARAALREDLEQARGLVEQARAALGADLEEGRAVLERSTRTLREDLVGARGTLEESRGLLAADLSDARETLERSRAALADDLASARDVLERSKSSLSGDLAEARELLERAKAALAADLEAARTLVSEASGALREDAAAARATLAEIDARAAEIRSAMARGQQPQAWRGFQSWPGVPGMPGST